jgi:hypothetical protein
LKAAIEFGMHDWLFSPAWGRAAENLGRKVGHLRFFLGHSVLKILAFIEPTMTANFRMPTPHYM